MKPSIRIAGFLILFAACTPTSPTASSTSLVSGGSHAPRQTPTARAGQVVITAESAIAWDGVDGRVMVVSLDGFPTTGGTTVLGAWTFGGSAWKAIAAPEVAPPVNQPFHLYLGYDSARNREVLVVSLQQPETFEWDGRAWHLMTTPHVPRGFTAGAYSPEANAFIGYDGTTYWYDTWIYDGVDWRSVRTTGTPFTSLLGIAYDANRRAVVALTGNSYTTMVWTGTDWTALAPPPSAPAIGAGWGRSSSAVGFDQRHSQWVVQGGADGEGTVLSDTSVGDESSWREAAAPPSPSPHYVAKMTWDPQRQAVVAFSDTEAWSWDGGAWTPLVGPGPSSPAACQPAASYGLLLVAGKLELVDTCARVVTSAPVAEASVLTCSSKVPADLEPPVSATRDLVFYRDGDTKIRSLSAGGQTADVTTVPGGASSVSFFSVSPDDQRIAVVVEDFSSANSIGLRLYVEDLRGGGHHVDLYSTTTNGAGTTLWPMGWNQGHLLLAVMPACITYGSPVSWHVVDATTGVRLASIDASSCGVLSQWPSPHGVVCAQPDGTGIYQWNGRELIGINGDVIGAGANYMCTSPRSSLSPDGELYFYSGSPSCAASGSFTRVEQNGTPRGGVPWRSGCLWIDDGHVLAPDAVITVGSTTPALLPAAGVCAGQFPVAT